MIISTHANGHCWLQTTAVSAPDATSSYSELEVRAAKLEAKVGGLDDSTNEGPHKKYPGRKLSVSRGDRKHIFRV